MITLQGFGHLETADYLRERIDKFGGVEAYNQVVRSTGCRSMWARMPMTSTIPSIIRSDSRSPWLSTDG
jgi:hypothetical protein